MPNWKITLRWQLHIGDSQFPCGHAARGSLVSPGTSPPRSVSRSARPALLWQDETVASCCVQGELAHLCGLGLGSRQMPRVPSSYSCAPPVRTQAEFQFHCLKVSCLRMRSSQMQFTLRWHWAGGPSKSVELRPVPKLLHSLPCERGSLPYDTSSVVQYRS